MHGLSKSPTRPSSRLTKNNSHSRSGSRSEVPRYMNPTAASALRTKANKSLSLREKIFELHDAVRTLQTKTVKIEKQNQQPKDLAAEVHYQASRIEAIENQNGVLKHALGTFADAVSDEIEEL